MVQTYEGLYLLHTSQFNFVYMNDYNTSENEFRINNLCGLQKKTFPSNKPQQATVFSAGTLSS